MYLQNKVEKIELIYDKYECELVVSISRLADFHIQESMPDFLNINEEKYYSGLHHERKKKSYLLGRHAAKVAVKAALNLENLKDAEISNGIFEQPVIRCKKNISSQISLSHCDNIGIAIVFPDTLIVGVDIEKVNIQRYHLLRKLISDSEKSILLEESESNIKMLTVMWSVKEALSKCIKTGFTIPMSFFEIKNLSHKNEVFTGHFIHFIQYQYVAFEQDNYVIAIVYPSQMQMKIPDKILGGGHISVEK